MESLYTQNGLLMPLTQKEVQHLTPQQKPYSKSDGDGLSLLVKPTGAKSWVLRFRMHDKARAMGLGGYPAISLKQARELARENQALIRQGVDPVRHRQKERLGATVAAERIFETAAMEWYEKAVVGKKADSTCAKKLSLLQRRVLPYIGRVPVSDLTVAEVESLLLRIHEDGTTETMHRCRRDLAKILHREIKNGHTERNVADMLRGELPSVTAADAGNFTAETDPEELAAMLRIFHGDRGKISRQVYYGLQLMPIIFPRHGDFRKMKWADLHLDNAQWHYKPEKTSRTTATDMVCPLPRQAVAILEELKIHAGRSPYVFPNARDRNRPMSDAAMLAALRRHDIPAEQTVIHGFKASASTLLEEVLREDKRYIEMQLCHVVKDLHGTAYNRTKFIKERTAMMQRWADYLDELRCKA